MLAFFYFLARRERMGLLICKKVYFQEDVIKRIEKQIKKTGQSFSDYIRKVVENTGASEWYLPTEYIEYHTNQMSELVNTVYACMNMVAEIENAENLIPDLMLLQIKLQEMVEVEKCLLQFVWNQQEERKNHGDNYLYTVQQ